MFRHVLNGQPLCLCGIPQITHFSNAHFEFLYVGPSLINPIHSQKILHNSKHYSPLDFITINYMVYIH